MFVCVGPAGVVEPNLRDLTLRLQTKPDARAEPIGVGLFELQFEFRRGLALGHSCPPPVLGSETKLKLRPGDRLP